MKKKAIVRGALGFPLGVFIGYLITISISLVEGSGGYSPAVPSLVTMCGNEIGAVMLQFLLSGILGSAFAAGSVVWEMDHWSIVKQTVVHFLIVSTSMLPIAYFAHWVEHTIRGMAIYFGIFVIMYILIWIVQYAAWKRRIKTINRRVQEKLSNVNNRPKA